MKPKAKTLQERMGFLDEDLTTPLHDEIVLWAKEEIPRRLKVKDPTTTIEQVVLEQPITHNKFVVGFIDLMIRGYVIKERVAVQKGASYIKRGPNGEHLGWEKAENDIIESVEDRFGLLLEVKTKIPSLGELLRQIRLYKEHQGGSYFIVSPDERFKEPIIEQGFGFIKYEPNK